MRWSVVFLALLCAAQLAFAVITCHSGLVVYEPSTVGPGGVFTGSPSGTGALCGGAALCEFVYDLEIDFDAGIVYRFDGWFGPNRVWFPPRRDLINLTYFCETFGSTVFIEITQNFVGGAMLLRFYFTVASPNFAMPAQWFTLIPTFIETAGGLPNGTAFEINIDSTPEALNESQIPCPAEEFCLDALVTVDGTGVPAETGCPVSGNCTMRILAGVNPEAMSLTYLDMLVGPAQASLISSPTIDISDATFFCFPEGNTFQLGNLPGLLELEWPLTVQCAAARADFGAAGSGGMETLLLEDPLTLGSYDAQSAAEIDGPVSSLEDAEIACSNISYSTTPTPSFSSTPTPTPSNTPTPTPSTTASATQTPTPSTTASASQTPTPSQTASQTSTATPSNTATQTPTSTPTGTPSQTGTLTPTASTTPTASSTQTPSTSSTATLSATPTPTASSTQTPSTSSTASLSATPTPSSTTTLTATQTATGTVTPTPSSTTTLTATQTPTGTPTQTPSTSSTATLSATPTPSSTTTLTATQTATGTATQTPSQTPSTTPSASPTASTTISLSAGMTPSTTATNTPTASVTETTTPTPSTSATQSATPTLSQTPTMTGTALPTQTPSGTPSQSLSSTPTPSQTPTMTGTALPTQTPSGTPSQSLSTTPTMTPTASPTQTPSGTASQSLSTTATVSLTRTSSPSGTVTPTRTATRTPSQTPSNSPSGMCVFFFLCRRPNFLSFFCIASVTPTFSPSDDDDGLPKPAIMAIVLGAVFAALICCMCCYCCWFPAAADTECDSCPRDHDNPLEGFLCEMRLLAPEVVQ